MNLQIIYSKNLLQISFKGNTLRIVNLKFYTTTWMPAFLDIFLHNVGDHGQQNKRKEHTV